ncbi:Pentatricopeptide repeat-containing protein At2g28050 [Linum perenne]
MILSSGIKISPYSLSVIVRRMGENWEVMMCREFVEEMICGEINPNVVTYNIILNACIRRWNLEEVETIFWFMKKEETSFDVMTYKMLIDGYTSCEKFDEVEGVVLDMNDNGFVGGGEIHLWNPIITRYCKKGFIEKTSLVFDKKDVKGVTPNVETYRELISVHCPKGNVEASRWFIISDGSDNNVFIFANNCAVLRNQHRVLLLPLKLHAKNTALSPSRSLYTMDLHSPAILLNHTRVILLSQ